MLTSLSDVSRTRWRASCENKNKTNWTDARWTGSINVCNQWMNGVGVHSRNYRLQQHNVVIVTLRVRTPIKHGRRKWQENWWLTEFDRRTRKILWNTHTVWMPTSLVVHDKQLNMQADWSTKHTLHNSTRIHWLGTADTCGLMVTQNIPWQLQHYNKFDIQLSWQVKYW